MELAPLRFLRNLSRSREIVTVLLNHGFHDIVDQLRLARLLQWWRRVLFRRKVKDPPGLTRAQRVRLVFEELGPTFVKFGQVVSTRPDLVPAEYLRELERLQEHVPPFSGEKACEILRQEFEAPVEELFSQFDRQPMAAGSLGQVHRAVLHDGTSVAVKIRRPSVVRDVERDLRLMAELAVLLERNFPETEIFDPSGLVQQFARSIRREMQFAREGRTLDEFRRLFRNDATLRVPRVYWDLTSDSVLTMDFMAGCRVNDLTSLAEWNLTPAQVACQGARIFMKMAFELGLFHGDPHPGNIRVLPDGVIGLIDYGMVGRLEAEKRDQLIDLLMAISQADIPGAVNVLLELGEPFREIDLPLFTADVRDFVESYYGFPLERIPIGRLLGDFLNILSTHGIRCPADLMLLIRAIITLEGVGRELDPEFNLAQHLRPFIEAQVQRRYSPEQIAGRVWKDVSKLMQNLHELPVHLNRTMKRLAENDLRIQFEHRNLDRLITEVDRSGNRLVIGLVMSALIVSSSLVLRATAETALWITIPTFLLSTMLGIWLIYGIFRSGRL